MTQQEWEDYWKPYLDEIKVGTICAFDPPYNDQRVVSIYTTSTDQGRPAQLGEVWFAWFERVDPHSTPLGHGVSIDEFELDRDTSPTCTNNCQYSSSGRCVVCGMHRNPWSPRH